MLQGFVRERRTELAVAGLVFATVFLIEIRSTITPELWWQLVSGDLILTDGFPDADVITWSQASQPWVIHGWLSHVLLAGLTAWLGVDSLPVIFAVLLGLAWTSLFVAAPGNPFGRAVVALIGAASAAPLTSADSRTVSLIMFAATVSIVELVARGRWPRLTAWALAPLWVLWANVDTWFLLGVSYVFMRAIGVRLARDREDALTDRIGAVIGAGAVGLAGTVVNPAGIGILPAAWERLTAGPRALIVDLQSPDFQLSTVWPWILLVGVIVLIMSLKPARSLSELFVFFGFLVAALVSYQYVGAHAMVAVPVGASVIAVGRNDRAPVAAIWGLAAAVVVLCAIVTPAAIATWSDEQPDIYPVEAVSVLAESGLGAERVFNELAWGGYLAYRDVAPFADTRYGFHETGFLTDTVDAMNALPAWRDLDAEFEPGVVIIRQDRGLAQLLDESPGWSLLHADDVAKVYVRDNAS